MRRTFLTWLLLLICTAYAVTGAMAYWQFKRSSRQQAEQLMVTRLHDMLELVDYTSSSVERLKRNNDEMALARTRAMAEIVRLNPATLTNQEVLQGICNDLGAEQAAITDEKGIIRAAVPASYRGFDLAADKDAARFLPCISTAGYEHVQRAEEQIRSTGLQFAGVHRQDADGLVRLGFRSQYEQRARQATAYGRLAANHRLGNTGRIVAFHGGAPLNREALPGPAADFLSMPLGKLMRMNFNGDEHFVYALKKKGTRLVGILPLRELYPMGMVNLRTRLIANSVIFLSVFALVCFLLQRYVVSSLASVNETLRRIGEGEQDARVNVVSTPEFVKLSTGINSMLDSLKVMNDQGRARLRKELELARALQRNALPSELPPHKDFELQASLMPCSSVGGDFYDYFMADDDHLTFMVASGSGTGVPVALFMMRSLSIIRSCSRSGQAPSAVLSAANRALCEGRTADMHLSLFFGTLELSTGTLTYVNAGQEAPLIQHLSENEYSELRQGRSPVLGAMEGIPYPSHRVELMPGDRLLLYTRGLTGAQNAHHEPFGMPRLLHALEGEATTLADLPVLVRQSLRRFTEDTPQEQDITMLAIEYQSIMRHGGKVQVQAGEPDAVHQLLTRSLESVLAAPLDILGLQDAASGILATLPPETPVTVILGCDEAHAELSFSYPGILFNPLEQLELPGIDDVSFSHLAENNHLTLSKVLG